MDGDSDSDSDSDTGDHSPAQGGAPDKERAMDAPFFVTAIIVTLVFVAIVFFIIH